MSEIVAALEWSTLLIDAKRIIVNLLDFESKHALSQCSKADRALVAQSTWIFDRIDYMVNRDGKKSMEVEHRFRRDVFWKNEEGPGVVCEKAYRLETERSFTVKSEQVVEGDDFQEVANRRLNEILRAQKFTVDELKLDLLTKPPVLAEKVRVKSLWISAEVRQIDASLLFRMLDSIEPTVDWLQFRLEHEIPRGLASLETVRKAKRLVFSGVSRMTDDELLRLDAEFLDIYTSEMTRNGMIRFIHKRYDEGKECDFDVNASGDERIEAGFECEFVPESERNVQIMNGYAKYRLTKNGSPFVLHLIDLEQSNVQGAIRKKT